MTTVTVLTDDAVEVEATVSDGRVAVAAQDLSAAMGWELKPEGLCRGDVCVPVADRSSLDAPDGIDLAAAAEAVGSTALFDAELSAMAVARSAAEREQVVHGMEAPDLRLPDLNGNEVSTASLRGRKKLLFVFASW